MLDMLMVYMRNNPVRIENHLPLKDLVAYGLNFDLLPPGANFYNPAELMEMEAKAERAYGEEEEVEGDSGVDDVGEPTGVFPKVKQIDKTVPHEGTSDVPPA